MYSCMLMSEDTPEAAGIEKALGLQRVTVIRSLPSYANYIKTLQYLPDMIIIGLPRSHGNELNYLQMVKQHRVAREIPVICYGASLAPEIQEGLIKIGVDKVVPAPLNIPDFIKTIVPYLKKRKLTRFPAPEQRPSTDPNVDKEIFAFLTSPKNSGQIKIEHFCENISKLMAFPFSVAKILKMTQSRESNAADLARVIQADPVLSAKMLQIGNSAYFGGGRNRISSIKDAVVRIGFAETRRIVISMSIMNLFDNQRATPGFNRIQFWRHCLSTGVMAEYFAARIPGLNKDEAFLCGLLHDFGLILFDEFAPALFSKLVAVTTDTGAHFIDKERELLGITHQDIVSALFEKWNIPPHITAAITGYAAVEKAILCPAGNDWQIRVCIVHANQFSKALMLGAGCDQFVAPLPAWTWDKIGCAHGFSVQDKDNIRAGIARYQELMGIQVDDPQPEGAPPAPHEIPAIGFLRYKAASYGPAIEYLVAKGNGVELISYEKDLSVYEDRFDMVIVESTQPLPSDLLQALSSIRSRIRSPENTAIAQLPLLVLTTKECRTRTASSNVQYSFLYSDCDLRNLDMSIGLLLMDASGFRKRPQPVEGGGTILPRRELSTLLKTLLAEAQLLYTVCRDRNITSPEVPKAAALLELFKKERPASETDEKALESTLKTAILYCRHAILLNEIHSIELGIHSLEIGKDGREIDNGRADPA
jgi:HD-like signal output (HDOD) protein